MVRLRIVFSGSGGQGVITAAILLGEAAVIHENLIAVQSQSYGPEARGGATRSDVIIWDQPILFPKVNNPNFLVCLTQKAYEKYMPAIRPGGIIITDQRYVKLHRKVDAFQLEFPIYREIIEKIGNPIVLNIGVLGIVCALIRIVRPESVIEVLKKRLPRDLIGINQRALDIGYDMGEAQRKKAALSPTVQTNA